MNFSQFNISQGAFGERPPVTKARPEFLQLVGEEGIRAMVNDHYEILIKSDAKHLFPDGGEALAKAKEHAADFMIQINGGPQYFNQKRGAPQMVGRHEPFKITKEARVIWLEAYASVLKELKAQDGSEIPPEILKSFWDYLDIFSLWMVNTPS